MAPSAEVPDAHLPLGGVVLQPLGQQRGRRALPLLTVAVQPAVTPRSSRRHIAWLSRPEHTQQVWGGGEEAAQPHRVVTPCGMTARPLTPAPPPPPLLYAQEGPPLCAQEGEDAVAAAADEGEGLWSGLPGPIEKLPSQETVYGVLRSISAGMSKCSAPTHPP